MSLDVSTGSGASGRCDQGATGVAQTDEELANRALLGRALLARDRHEQGGALARVEFDQEAGAVLANLRRPRIESDRRAAHDAVETVVQEHDAVLSARAFDRPPTLPTMTAKLKDISEVRREIKHKLEGVRIRAKVVHAEPLVTRAVEEKL